MLIPNHRHKCTCPGTAKWPRKRRKLKDLHIPVSNFIQNPQKSRACGIGIRADVDNWNRIESPETNLNIYGQLILKIGAKTFKSGKDRFFSRNRAETMRYMQKRRRREDQRGGGRRTRGEEARGGGGDGEEEEEWGGGRKRRESGGRKPRPSCHSRCRINSKCVTDLIMIIITLKLQEENRRRSLWSLMRQHFLNMTPKAWSRKADLINRVLSKLKICALWKRPLSKSKDKPESGKYMQITYLLKSLYLEFVKNLHNPKNKEDKQPIFFFLMGQNRNRLFTHEDRHIV